MENNFVTKAVAFFVILIFAITLVPSAVFAAEQPIPEESAPLTEEVVTTPAEPVGVPTPTSPPRETAPPEDNTDLNSTEPDGSPTPALSPEEPLAGQEAEPAPGAEAAPQPTEALQEPILEEPDPSPETVLPLQKEIEAIEETDANAMVPSNADIVGDYEYLVNPDGKTVTITRYIGAGGNVKIPGTLAGMTVTAIGDLAFVPIESVPPPVTGISFPDSITSIGVNAFSNCTSLRGPLVLPAKLQRIESYAFIGCTGLTGGLSIPDSVTIIMEGVFDGCTGLNGPLKLSSSLISIGEFAFSSCRGLTGNLTIPDSVTVIKDLAFSECIGFKGALTLPRSLTAIGELAFRNCKGLTGSLTIPPGVKKIGVGAFWECAGFNGTLSLPEGLEFIGRDAFFDCSRLTGNLIIPQSVRTIEEYAFADCFSMNGKLVLPSGLKSIESGVFTGCTQLTGNLILPPELQSIESGAFLGCAGLTGTLTIPDSVKTIGQGAFFDCTGFSGPLTLPAGLIAIETWAFAQCANISGTLTLPDGIDSVGFGAFYYDKKLAGVILPDSISSIGAEAFYGCYGLKKIVIPSSVTAIPENTFSQHYGQVDMDIYGIPGSYAQQYARQHGFDFRNSAAPYATSLRLSRTVLLIKPKQTVRLKSAVTPRAVLDKSVSWKSSNPKVAKVGHLTGKVTGIRKGRAVIVANTRNHKKARCTVYVSGAAVEKVRLNKTRATLRRGRTLKLKATVFPADASHKKILWKSSDPAKATVSAKGTVKTLKKGRVSITATTEQGKKVARCIVTIK